MRFLVVFNLILASLTAPGVPLLIDNTHNGITFGIGLSTKVDLDEESPNLRNVSELEEEIETLSFSTKDLKVNPITQHQTHRLERYTPPFLDPVTWPPRG